MPSTEVVRRAQELARSPVFRPRRQPRAPPKDGAADRAMLYTPQPDRAASAASTSASARASSATPKKPVATPNPPTVAAPMAPPAKSGPKAHAPPKVPPSPPAKGTGSAVAQSIYSTLQSKVEAAERGAEAARREHAACTSELQAANAEARRAAQEAAAARTEKDSARLQLAAKEREQERVQERADRLAAKAAGVEAANAAAHEALRAAETARRELETARSASDAAEQQAATAQTKLRDCQALLRESGATMSQEVNGLIQAKDASEAEKAAAVESEARAKEAQLRAQSSLAQAEQARDDAKRALERIERAQQEKDASIMSMTQRARELEENDTRQKEALQIATQNAELIKAQMETTEQTRQEMEAETAYLRGEMESRAAQRELEIQEENDRAIVMADAASALARQVEELTKQKTEAEVATEQCQARFAEATRAAEQASSVNASRALEALQLADQRVAAETERAQQTARDAAALASELQRCQNTLHTEIQTEKDALRTEIHLYATLAWWTQNEDEISAIARGINEAQFGTRVEVYRETNRRMQGMAEKLQLLANVQGDLRAKCSMTRTAGQVCAGCEAIMGGTTMDDTIRRIARHARELHAAIIANDERPSASAFLRESTSGLMKRLQAHQAASCTGECVLVIDGGNLPVQFAIESGKPMATFEENFVDGVRRNMTLKCAYTWGSIWDGKMRIDAVDGVQGMVEDNKSELWPVLEIQNEGNGRGLLYALGLSNCINNVCDVTHTSLRADLIEIVKKQLRAAPNVFATPSGPTPEEIRARARAAMYSKDENSDWSYHFATSKERMSTDESALAKYLFTFNKRYAELGELEIDAFAKRYDRRVCVWSTSGGSIMKMQYKSGSFEHSQVLGSHSPIQNFGSCIHLRHYDTGKGGRRGHYTLLALLCPASKSVKITRPRLT